MYLDSNDAPENFSDSGYGGQGQSPSIMINEIEEERDIDMSHKGEASEMLMGSKLPSMDGNIRSDNILRGKEDITNSFIRPPDLRFLASSNFSSDSLTDSQQSPINHSIPPPLSPSWNNSNQTTSVPPYSPVGTSMSSNIGVPFHNRRYSNSSLSNSPITQPSASSHIRAGSGTRPRPKSAIFLMDSNNYSISEHGSPIQSPIQNNTPRARNSMHFSGKTNYIPSSHGGSLSIAPPTVSSSNRLSRSPSPSRSSSPTRNLYNYRAKSPVRRSNSPSKYQPFNFKPQEVMLHGNGSTNSLSIKPAQRKGHKYKHSSVSMNLFQEPPPALIINNQQSAIPDLYPIPNFKESLNSIKPEQKLKLGWSFVHIFLSISVFMVGYQFKLPAFSTLAHLVFYDSLGSLIMVFVDIMSNFEVWNSSSIAYPFGLERLEVLVGFALSASLIMVGCDLVSHFLEEFVILLVVNDPVGEHEGEQHHSHHIHAESGSATNWVVYEFILLLVLGVTLITSKFVIASDRINEMISGPEEILKTNTLKINRSSRNKKGLIEYSSKNLATNSYARKLLIIWGGLTNNPMRLLTLLYTVYLIILPVIPSSFTDEIAFDSDEATTLIVAVLLCYTGWRLVKALGGILLLSYPYSDYDYNLLKATIIDKIFTLDCYKRSYSIEKLFVTKFSYELFVVGLKISMKNASIDDESRLRFEVNRLIVSSVEKAEFSIRPSNIETTIDISRY